MPQSYDSNAPFHTCKHCRGIGVVESTVTCPCPECARNPHAFRQGCSLCGGSGSWQLDVENACPTCQGEGRLYLPAPGFGKRAA
jgi:DnaJ-class molecular chaperone